MDRRVADKWAARFIVGAAVCSPLVLIFVFVVMNAGAFTRPSDIRVDNPALAVHDARVLIERKRQSPGSFGDFTEPRDLPPSLQIGKLRYAKIHIDHVNLVVARNPDTSIGARIWAARHRAHEDQPTRYPDIWFYRYSHEAPQSVTNIQ